MPFASDGDVMKHTPAINDTVSTARCVSFGRATAVCARRLVVHVGRTSTAADQAAQHARRTRGFVSFSARVRATRPLVGAPASARVL